MKNIKVYKYDEDLKETLLSDFDVDDYDDVLEIPDDIVFMHLDPDDIPPHTRNDGAFDNYNVYGENDKSETPLPKLHVVITQGA